MMSDELQDIENGEYRAGFVAILGKPNAGKSTMVNALLGEKLAAVSGLAQTTRDRIHAILSGDDYQIIFVDLPGLVEATDKLNEALRNRVLDSIDGVDCIVHLVDVTDDEPVTEDMAELIARINVPMILAVNKIDKKSAGFDAKSWAGELRPRVDPKNYRAIFGISAQFGKNLDALREEIRATLPPGPPLYDPEQLTDRDMRFLAAELIREKVFHFTHQEVPYSTAVQIEEFAERSTGKWFISAVIHLERDTQKGIVIGKKGTMLKQISMAARKDIEALTGEGVFLELHVKVTKNWTKNESRLREFGYDTRPHKGGRRRR
ncbi:GTPase Era [bacterium]|nr:GTPase Era [bacterium]